MTFSGKYYLIIIVHVDCDNSYQKRFALPSTKRNDSLLQLIFLAVLKLVAVMVNLFRTPII